MAARMISHWDMINVTHKHGGNTKTQRKTKTNTLDIDNLLDLQVFTFGAPLTLTGNVFHSHINVLSKNLFNFVNRFDIVPRMLGDHNDNLYPSFLWKDQLLTNKLKSFFPIGNYYFLHSYNQIIPYKRPQKLTHLGKLSLGNLKKIICTITHTSKLILLYYLNSTTYKISLSSFIINSTWC